MSITLVVQGLETGLFFHGPLRAGCTLGDRREQIILGSWPLGLRLLTGSGGRRNLKRVDTCGQNRSLGALRVGCALGDRREQKKETLLLHGL